jgi:hypothetical protein
MGAHDDLREPNMMADRALHNYMAIAGLAHRACRRRHAGLRDGRCRRFYYEFAEIVDLVDAKGWRVDLGTICRAFGLPWPATGCVFRQVSVHEVDGRGDPRGVNVPEHAGTDVPYVLVFHLTSQIGEFYVVSPRGELLKAFQRQKGRGYDALPLDDVRMEFERDLAYWRGNFPRIKRGLAAESGPGR